MSTKLQLNFDKLPLVEAAVRASLHSPMVLTYAVINAIAAELQSSFPTLTEPKQFEIAPGIGTAATEFGPNTLPGAVYSGNQHGLSVSLQPRVLVARWVKPPAIAEPRYPRYPALRDALWLAVEGFRKACGDNYPGIAVVNMSYVNFVPVTDPASFLKTYFVDEANLKAMNRARQIRKLEGAWSEADDLDVRFSIEQGAAKLPDRVAPGYQLTTAAGLRPGESVDAKTGLEKVHDKLQEFFLMLISDKAKAEWGFREASRA